MAYEAHMSQSPLLLPAKENQTNLENQKTIFKSFLFWGDELHEIDMI